MPAAERSSRSRAAWLLAVLLGAAAWPASRPARPPCEWPRAAPATRERGSLDWTREVRCSERTSAMPLPRGPARLLFGIPLDPNRADAGSLEVLPGIGPALARALVEAAREQPFCGPRDLDAGDRRGSAEAEVQLWRIL